MFSVLYSKNGTSKRAESGSQFSFNTQYLSLSAGPAWRINPYVSVYGLVGASSLRSDLEYRTPSQRKVRKKSKRRLRAKPRSRGSIHHVHEFSSDYGLAGGVGVQFNLSKNLVLDTSWEYSWLRNNRISSWGIGLGYRFCCLEPINGENTITKKMIASAAAGKRVRSVIYLGKVLNKQK